MASDRRLCGIGRRRGIARAAVPLCAALVASLLALGCGERGNGAETDPEKGFDAAVLNQSLGRELTLLTAYTEGREIASASLAAVLRAFRAQQQEYVDAIQKAIRGLGGRAEAEPAELELGGLEGERDLLDLLYELESAALAAYVEAAPRLYTAAPRTLAASLAAGHAQHLVPLRQALGAGLAASVPEAFDGGRVPPPGAAEPPAGG